MKLKMISWNVRGLNDPQKRLVVRNLLRKWKCDIVCLQETKLAGLDRQLVCSIWGCPYMDWVALDANQIAGGVLIMWDRRIIEKLEVLVGLFSVFVQWKGVADGFIWACSGVYGPNDNRLRGALWDEVVFISFGMFLDLPLERGRYTWSSGTDQPFMSRIDRALVSHEWEHHFPDMIQRILPRTVSDHFPILLEAGGMARGKSPFRFENMWLKTDGFVDRVESWWNRHSFSGTPSYVFAKKLKALKDDIIQWNCQEFGNVGRRKKELLGVLEVLDAKEGVLGLTKTEKEERNEARSQVEHLLSLEEISWRQKSRMLCIKEGDNNTKFFHKMANSHRGLNHLSFLEVDGMIYEDGAEVAAQVVQFYKTLYQESEEWRPFVEGLEFDQIEELERGWLEREVRER
ncbi:uncharacterized protein LOC136064694 [Quercus suber]|uniref:uncharacterized protein LOC136064694 n=1 Tax=Quercus suber TaxID=58331 RepID=UPI0032DEEEF2